MAEATLALSRSAHVDSFCRDRLPPPELWPAIDLSGVPETLAYPERMNAATWLLDGRVLHGDGERTALVYNGSRISYRELLERANQIAHVLVDECGIVPGNRVLLRGANTPMMIACWYAVLKVGAVA